MIRTASYTLLGLSLLLAPSVAHANKDKDKDKPKGPAAPAPTPVLTPTPTAAPVSLNTCTAWTPSQVGLTYLGCLGGFELTPPKSLNQTQNNNWIEALLETSKDWKTAPAATSTGAYGDFKYLGKSEDLPEETGSTGSFTPFETVSGLFVLGLKGSTGASFYLFESQGPVGSIDFSMIGVPKANGDDNPGLSHYALWQGRKPTEVPEPASLGLLAAGLAGLGVAARRRKA